MKKLILGTILFLLSSTISGMEESNKNQFNILTELSKHHPMLPMKIIEEGIKSALESSLESPENRFNPVKAVINAYKYINTITSVDTFWRSKRAELIEMLKDLAKKNEDLTWGYDYSDQKELNDKLSEYMYDLFARIKKGESEKIRKEISENKCFERIGIAQLIIGGADPNFQREGLFYNEACTGGLLQLMINLEDVDLVLLLVIYGADVNHKDCRDLSPLETAIWANHPHSDVHKVEKIINLLIMHGAKANERNAFGRNIVIQRLFHSKNRQDIFLETFLKDGLKLNEEDIELIKEMTILHNGYKSAAYEKIAEILKKYGYQI